MKRGLFNLLAAVSLALFLGDAFLHYRSSIVRDEISFQQRRKLVIASDRGRIELAFATCATGTLTPMGPYAFGLTRGALTVYSKQLEIRWKSFEPGGNSNAITSDQLGIHSARVDTYDNGYLSANSATTLVNDVLAITLPNLFLLGLFAALPAIWLIKYHRHRLDFCPLCGRDMRPTRNRCPQCEMPATIETES